MKRIDKIIMIPTENGFIGGFTDAINGKDEPQRIKTNDKCETNQSCADTQGCTNTCTNKSCK